MMDMMPLVEAGFFGFVVIGILMGVAAYFLFKQKEPQVITDDKPTTATLRGAFVPLVFGLRRIGPVIGWVGDRITTEECEDVGGKGDGGGQTCRTIFHERAIHFLGIGPGCRIHNIYVDGRCLQNSYMDRILNPSGSTLNLGAEWGSLRVFWGDMDQPLSPLVTTEFGIATRLPRVIRVEWDRFRMGANPRWPIIEYDLEVCVTGINPFTFPSELLDVDGETGLNGAYIMYQLLTAPFPYGIGMPGGWLDPTQLEDLGALMSSEGIPMNILVQDGQNAEQVVAILLQDMGAMLSDCCGKLAFIPIREFLATIPVLTNDLLLPPFDEVEQVHEEQRFDKLVFEYPDKNLNFKVGTIDIDDDGQSDFNNRHKTRKIRIGSVTSRKVASIVADRRALEELVPPLRIKAKGARNLREALPGNVFSLPGVGQVRVLTVSYTVDSPTVDIEFFRDYYSQAPTGFIDPDLPEPEAPVIADDLRWTFFEVPAAVASGVIHVVDLRHRANTSIQGAQGYISVADVSFSSMGTQPSSASSGYLAEAWTPPSDTYVIDAGPKIIFDSEDELANRLLDLSADEEAWRQGRQTLLLRDEVFFVKSVIPLGGNIWQLREVIRARFDSVLLVAADNFLPHQAALNAAISTIDGTGPISVNISDLFTDSGVILVDTEQIDYGTNDRAADDFKDKIVRGAHGTPGATHSSGAIVNEIIPMFISNAPTLVLMTSPFLASEATFFFKNQPFNSQGAVSLGDIESQPLFIRGKGVRPLPMPWSACGGNGAENGIATNFGGRARRDGRFVGEPAHAEDLVFEVTFGTANATGTSDRVPWNSGIAEALLSGAIEFRVQKAFIEAGEPPDIPPDQVAFNAAFWVTAVTAVLTSSGIQGGDITDGGVFNGIGTWVFKAGDIFTQLLDNAGLGPPATPTSLVDWRVEIAHVVNGISSEPLYCYPLQVDDLEVPNIPV